MKYKVTITLSDIEATNSEEAKEVALEQVKDFGTFQFEVMKDE